MPKKTESFENLMGRLEEIVNEMDSGELSLEDSMKKYEEGIKISNKLYKILNEAEGKIKILTEKGDKEFQL
ncbi:exodeoxyribonuclease VII small subunit [Clostridium lundense]|uniref:exodeoxyribonuclease VII small subunit n=1 Tax=Clostridium lundense TaxID=319475 RepID=UPI00047F501A|nr:exodeoxyribonuclease VII small subunit [Clostridium lundense]